MNFILGYPHAMTPTSPTSSSSSSSHISLNQNGTSQNLPSSLHVDMTKNQDENRTRSASIHSGSSHSQYHDSAIFQNPNPPDVTVLNDLFEAVLVSALFYLISILYGSIFLFLF